VLYPLFLKVEGRTVLVVGAGSVAERKTLDLLEAGAKVRVVAPEGEVDPRAEWRRRPFEETDLDGVWLAVAATDQPEVQREVARACEARRIFLVAVDDVTHASAYGASVLHRDPITVAISSSGEAPALARLLREILEQALPADDWIEAAKALREKWKREGTPMGSRFAELVRAFKARP
jgi:uroporphyrin-III C-methyltransferase/precorrin-2 dehydrogenase/sirohydrochlorin ferrochelatase